jgi:uncharacterized protein (DUF736 family)
MATIGTFSATSDGGWEGRIRTLTINVRARLVPNDNRESDKAPDYVVMAGPVELGAAWIYRRKEDPRREYLSVQLDDPSLTKPISALLYFVHGKDGARLVWSRHRE